MKKVMLLILLFMLSFASFATEPRMFYICVVDGSGMEYDFTEVPYDFVTFKYWISSRPWEVCDQTDWQCGYEDFDQGISAIYFDLQNFPTQWQAGDQLNVRIIDDNNPYDTFWRQADYFQILDADSGPVFIGFDKYYGPGSGGMPISIQPITGGSNISTINYPCLTTAGTDLNLVGLLFDTGYQNASDLDPTGTNITAVSHWNAENQAWNTAGYHPSLGWTSDFAVQTGQAYMINAQQNFDFTVTGTYTEASYGLITTEDTDRNMILHPVSKIFLDSLSELGDNIGTVNISTVSKWNAVTQTWVSSSYSPILGWVSDKPSDAGSGLLLNMKNSLTWPAPDKLESIIDVQNNENTIPKGAGGLPRAVYFNIVDDQGNPLDYPEDTGLIEYSAWIQERPTEILHEYSYGCGFTMADSYSMAYVEVGNFPSPWTAGETLKLFLTNFDPMYGCEMSVVLDNSASPVYVGFEPLIPGSGLPGQADMDHINPLTGVDPSIREESGNIVLEWGWAGYDVTGYNIYSSDEPNGTFSYVTTTSNLSWSTAATENRKFFYVVSTNAKSSVPPKTITVKEKK